MTADIRQLATAYVTAIGDKRFDRLEELLHPDATVGGMGRKLQGRKEFAGGPRRIAPIVLRNEIKRIFVDGNEALVIYDLVTDTPAGAILTNEWLTFEDGLILSSIIVFDGRRWPEAMEELQRRVAAASAATA